MNHLSKSFVLYLLAGRSTSSCIASKTFKISMTEAADFEKRKPTWYNFEFHDLSLSKTLDLMYCHVKSTD